AQAEDMVGMTEAEARLPQAGQRVTQPAYPRHARPAETRLFQRYLPSSLLDAVAGDNEPRAARRPAEAGDRRRARLMDVEHVIRSARTSRGHDVPTKQQWETEPRPIPSQASRHFLGAEVLHGRSEE